MSDVEVEISQGQNTNLDETYVDEYWSIYRQHIHTLLAWGYANSRNRVQAKHDEPAITGFIAEAIQDILDDPDSPPWCNQIVIKDDPPIPGGGRTGRNRWRPDLIFEFSGEKASTKVSFRGKTITQAAKHK